MTVILAAARVQVLSTRRNPAHLLVLAMAPFFSAIFLAQSHYFGRSTGVVNAVIAPGLIGLWFVCLDLAGGLISTERWQGRLELLVASPARLSAVVFGRVVVIVLVGSLAFAESWLVAWLGFGVEVGIARPALFAASLFATCLAMACTAVLISAAFVVSRVMDTFQSSLGYPFYIVGGVVVPVALLPSWLQPVSHVVFLSWGAELLRRSAVGDVPGDWPLRLLAVLGLGLLALAAGVAVTEWAVRRLRVDGTVTFS